MNILHRLTTKRIPNTQDIKQYTNDLKSMTLLRNNASNEEEKQRYDHIIEIMQRTLIAVIEPNG